MPFAAMDSISIDPVDPIGAHQHSAMLGELSPEAIETLVEVAGAGSGSPLIVLELRQLGGALQRTADRLSTMGMGDSKFIMNGVGPAFTPEMAEGSLLRHTATRLRRDAPLHASGARRRPDLQAHVQLRRHRRARTRLDQAQ